MLCLLCLTASDQNRQIQIFEQQGLSLDVCSIIVKHFWLQPSQDDANAKVICYSCWNVVDAFHKFYQKVEAAHLQLNTTLSAIEDDLKEEDASDTDVFDSRNDFVPTDVKLEVKEDADVGLPQNNPLREAKTNVHLQRIENTKNPIESDTDSEIPLAKLAQRRKSTSRLDSTFNTSPTDNKLASSTNEIAYQSTKPKARTKKVKKPNCQQQPLKAEAEVNRVKRKVIDPVKKRGLSQQFDEIIKKHMELSCNICHIPLSNFFLLRKHYHTSHKERGYATCCGKKFLKRVLLVDHINIHLNPEYFKCHKCDKVLADRRGLEVHMNTHNTTKQRNYQCDECNKSFYRKILLERHMYTHIPEKKFSCDSCDKLFSTSYTLKQHKNYVHKSAYMKICEQCGKSIRGVEAFRRHQLEHSGVPLPLVECEKCGVKLTTKYGLKRHMDSMHPETKVLHECQVCGKIAPSAAALQRHISYMHKCERNHKCPMCDKAFKKPGILRPSAENAKDKVICDTCWIELDSFHKFYKKIEEAHSNLIRTWSGEPVGSTDILSTAIRIAGIKKDEESDDMEDAVSSDEDSDNEADLKIGRVPKDDLDQIISKYMKLSCNICQEPMKNFFMLERHFESVHNESGYVICCKQKFKTRNSLADHAYLDHHLVYLCDQCGQVMADCKAIPTNCKTTINVSSEVTLRIVKKKQLNYQN